MRWAWLVAVALSCGAPSEPGRLAPQAPRADLPDPFPPIAPFRIGHAFEPTEVRARLAIGERITGHVEIDGDLAGGGSLVQPTALRLPRCPSPPPNPRCSGSTAASP